MEPNLVFFPYESELEFNDDYSLYPLGLPHSKIAVKMYQDSVRAIRSNAVTNNIMNELLENRRNEDYYNWLDNKVSKYTACSNVIANEIANLYKRDDLDFEDWHYLLLYKKFSRILTERGHCSEETITSLIYNLVNLIRNDLNLRNLLILSSDDYVEVLLTRFVEMAMNEKIYDYEYSKPHIDEYKMKAIRKHLQRSTKAASKAHSVSKLWGWMEEDQVIPPPTPISAPSRLNPENYYVYGRQLKASSTGETQGVNIRDGCIPVPRVLFPHGDFGTSGKLSKGSNIIGASYSKSGNKENKEKKISKRFGPRGPYKRTIIRMRMREISRKRRIFQNKDDPNQSTEEETDDQIDSSKEESELKDMVEGDMKDGKVEEKDNIDENVLEENEYKEDNSRRSSSNNDINKEDKVEEDREDMTSVTKTTTKKSQIRTRNTKLRSTKPTSVELDSIKDLMVVTENVDIRKDNINPEEGFNVDQKNLDEPDNKNKENINKGKEGSSVSKEVDVSNTDKENELVGDNDNKKNKEQPEKEQEDQTDIGVRTTEIGTEIGKLTQEVNREKENIRNTRKSNRIDEIRNKSTDGLVAHVKTELPSHNLDMYGRPINYLSGNMNINGSRNINYNRITPKREPLFDRDLACPIELNRIENSNGKRFDPYPGYTSNYLNHLTENGVQKSLSGSHMMDHSTRTPKSLSSTLSPNKEFETITSLYRQFNIDYSDNGKSNVSSDPTSDEYSTPNLIIGMNRNIGGFPTSNMDMGLFDDILECNLVYYKGDEDMISFEMDEPESEVSPLKRLKTNDPFHSKPIPDDLNCRRSTRLNKINGIKKKDKEDKNENKEDRKDNNNNKEKKGGSNTNKEDNNIRKEKEHKDNKRKGDDTIWDMVQKHQKSGSGTNFNVNKPMNNTSREIPEDKDDMSLLIREHYHVSENVPSSQTQPYVNAYKTPKSIKWSYTDTKRFYNAIETFGTDLLLVRAYLPEYTDRQVYDKFKLEERKNPQLMQNALQTHKNISLKQYEQKHGKIDTNTHYNPLKDPLLQEETHSNKKSLKLNMNSSSGMTTESHQKVDDKIINLFM